MALSLNTDIPSLVGLAAGAIDQELTAQIEAAIQQHIAPTVRAMAERTARDLIGRAEVHMQRDTRDATWKVAVNFITKD